MVAGRGVGGTDHPGADSRPPLNSPIFGLQKIAVVPANAGHIARRLSCLAVDPQNGAGDVMDSCWVSISGKMPGQRRGSSPALTYVLSGLCAAIAGTLWRRRYSCGADANTRRVMAELSDAILAVRLLSMIADKADSLELTACGGGADYSG